MKKALIVAMLGVFLIASFSIAADMITMKAKTGNVTFNHKAHGDAQTCKPCHGEGAPGKLTLGKDAAHKLCKGCHDAKKAGPSKCMDCHKK